MLTEILPPYPVKIRKSRCCHDCLRRFDQGSEMYTSVWKDDSVYRLWECPDCINWMANNRMIVNQVACDDGGLESGWIRDMCITPDYLK